MEGGLFASVLTWLPMHLAGSVVRMECIPSWVELVEVEAGRTGSINGPNGLWACRIARQMSSCSVFFCFFFFFQIERQKCTDVSPSCVCCHVNPHPCSWPEIHQTRVTFGCAGDVAASVGRVRMFATVCLFSIVVLVKRWDWTWNRSSELRHAAHGYGHSSLICGCDAECCIIFFDFLADSGWPDGPSSRREMVSLALHGPLIQYTFLHYCDVTTEHFDLAVPTMFYELFDVWTQRWFGKTSHFSSKWHHISLAPPFSLSLLIYLPNCQNNYSFQFWQQVRSRCCNEPHLGDHKQRAIKVKALNLARLLPFFSSPWPSLHA